MSEVNDHVILQELTNPAIVPSDTNHKATLKDLRLEDKQRIANLIKELARYKV